jgi:threonine dehydratase
MPKASQYPSALTRADYLKRILTARVYDVAKETPLTLAPLLSERLGNSVYLKREDEQSVFSFKLRGAYNKMVRLTDAQKKRGVIAASAGNHAQGVALSAQALGCKAIIVMPVTTPQVKIDAVIARGSKVVLHGDSYSDAYQHALTLQTKQGLTFVHPFDDPDVIAGQGTIGMEILRQHQGPLDAVFIAIGGGGLISGVAAYIKQVRPEVKIIGVQSEDSCAMFQSIQAGKRIELKEVGLFADGTAVKLVGQETFALARELVDEIVLVDTDAICAAIKDVFQETRSILEPSGALAIAGAKAWVTRTGCKKQTLVAIACGANMNFDRLRFVSERAEVGEQREAVFGVTMPEERGSFKRFCALLGERNVTEFSYRMSDSARAHVFVGLQVSHAADLKAVSQSLKKQRFEFVDLTHDEMAKSHLRHLVGGRTVAAANEMLYRFEFPERPGALFKFLNNMNPSWNISLFHYRNHGADYGKILVGLQVPANENKAFKAFLLNLGYPHHNESDNPAYKMFLR